jgi:hypothetical protein
MKSPFRTEFMAIPIALAILGLLFLVMLAAVEGVWAWVLLGLGVLALLTAVAVALGKRHRHPSALDAPATLPSRAAYGAEDGPDGTFRVVVVCDESCTSSTLSDELLRHAAGRPVEAFVVAPALGSRLAHWTGDDTGRARAEDHLESTVRALAEVGISAHGTIGSDDPVEAADDALRQFPADELVFATHAEAGANWLERDVVRVAEKRYEVPTIHIDVGD